MRSVVARQQTNCTSKMATKRTEGRLPDQSLNEETILSSDPSLEELKTTLRSVQSAHKNLDLLLSLLRLLRRDLETVKKNTKLVTSTNRKAMAVFRPVERKRFGAK